MRRSATVVLFVIATLAVGGAVEAQPTPLPAPLEPWEAWVLHGHEAERCPFLNAAAESRPCVWPSRLTLVAEERFGAFEQEWLVFNEAWVPLPGDAKRWPLDVDADGERALVVLQDGRPSILLAPGRHQVTGHFTWDAMPEMLQIPPETGLLSLTLLGRRIPIPDRDSRGRVWLERRAAPAEQEESRLDVLVDRKVVDDIPMILVTNIRLRVSGQDRELLLGKAFPEGFIPMSLESQLPARVESDGRVRVQARPGEWSLVLTARGDGPITRVTLAPPDGPWDGEEVWVFEARSDLRLVKVRGATAVDPAQTNLPADWRQLPAYVMRPGETMVFEEERRGDEDPAPDQLALQRTWWLDFDGGGYTVHDRITGTLSRSWRLEMAAPTRLGRVAMRGQDQLVTRLPGRHLAGVEVRDASIDLDADSRLVGPVSVLPSVGWNHDFHKLSATLNLPPGWRLFFATGVDDVAPTWITRWTLLDLFIVLVASLATARLWGWLAGMIALVALTLGYTEAGAPRNVWLAVLAAEALARVLPGGRLSSVVKLARIGAVAALLVITIPFVVQQVRAGIYPALERPGTVVAKDAVSPAEVADEYLGQAMRQLANDDKLGAAKSRSGILYQAIDPTAVVQTGPGLPAWHWSRVTLGWRGPVERGQELRLYLLPPAINLVLAVARALFTGLLVIYLIGGWKRSRRRRLPAAAAALLLIAPWILPAAPARADFPSTQMLDELRSRLLEPPSCHPQCAAIERLWLEVLPDTLRARMQVNVAAETAVPLPGSAQQWSPDTVLLNGEPAPGLLRSEDGSLWAQLAAGRHELLLGGPLPESDVVQIALPLRPHRVEATTEGWRIEGLHEDGLADASLQLTRAGAPRDTAITRLEPGNLPPFARVRRSLSLGLTWQVDTSVERVTPPGAAIVLAVPLLPGESVISADVRTADGVVELNMAPGISRVEWRSSLEETPELNLKAPQSLFWNEIWRLDVSPIWHAKVQGIPTIHLPVDEATTRVREWWPWPGESVAIAIERPAGTGGQTLTIDHSVMTVTPGLRATDVTLEIDLRSSRGGEHAIVLPSSATLQSVAMNGEVQPIRQEGRSVTLPITPGTQKALLAWRQKGGITRRFTTPQVDLATASVNSEIQLSLPADRWILHATGPRLGPAVLFWSLLAVLLCASLALGRVSLTPLRARHWFLLAVGLTQVPIWVALIVAGWLLALGWRREHGAALDNPPFNLIQTLLVGWTIVALTGLVWSIRQGLLGLPEMQIAGNGSTSHLLRWYLDASGGILPHSTVFTVPLLAYRLTMLVWALWLAQAVLRWLAWGWQSFSEGDLWRPLRKKAAAPS